MVGFDLDMIDVYCFFEYDDDQGRDYTSLLDNGHINLLSKLSCSSILAF